MASLYGHSEKVDLILLQSQPSILHTSGPGVLEALSKLDEESCPECYLLLDEIRLGPRVSKQSAPVFLTSVFVLSIFCNEVGRVGGNP